MKLEFVDPDFTMTDLLYLTLKNQTITAGAPKEPFTSILRSAFDVICDELDLTGDPRDVEVALVEGLQAHAQTRNDRTDPFHVIIEMNGDPHNIIAALAHEMVHVRDLSDGTLTYENDDLTYKGVVITKEMTKGARKANIQDKVLGFERVAYDKMWYLAGKVWEGLAPKHQFFLNMIYRMTLPPPTVDLYYKVRLKERKLEMKEAEKAWELAKDKVPDEYAKYASIYDTP